MPKKSKNRAENRSEGDNLMIEKTVKEKIKASGLKN